VESGAGSRNDVGRPTTSVVGQAAFCINNQQHISRLAIVARAFVFCLGCALILAVLSPLVARIAGQFSVLVTGEVAAVWAYFLTVFFARWDGISLKDVGAIPTTGTAHRFGAGFLIGSLLVALTAAASFGINHVHWTRDPNVGWKAAAYALATYLVLACREELAFHGYPLRNLKRHFGIWPAQLFIALLFAVEHRIGGYTWPQAILGAGLGSLLFGMAAIATRGLAVPIGLHCAWNFGQWLIGEKDSAGKWTETIAAGHEQTSYVARFAVYIVIICSATLSFWLWNRCRADEPTV
jgi:membrane protease YdiL (CAAX protease family)